MDFSTHDSDISTHKIVVNIPRVKYIAHSQSDPLSKFELCSPEKRDARDVCVYCSYIFRHVLFAYIQYLLEVSTPLTFLSIFY